VLPAEYRDTAGKAVLLGHAHAGDARDDGLDGDLVDDRGRSEIEVTSPTPIVAFRCSASCRSPKPRRPTAPTSIYLFLGGFVLALAIQRWGLDRRIAFQALKWVGTRPAAIVAGIMGATAFVSMWVSNTATAANDGANRALDYRPVARATHGQDTGRARRHPARKTPTTEISRCRCYLGVAYAASIGG